MAEAITRTNFDLPAQTGEVYHGKVADTYTISGPEVGVEEGDLLVVVRTDRLSAYNAVLPQPVPYKGQVLNEMSARLLEVTGDQVPNWQIGAVDPHISIGYKAEPVLVEMIIRASLLGSAWKAYSKEGLRELCGNKLPEGMREFQFFERPLVTPTTKNKDDTPITPAEIIERGLATAEEYEQIEAMSLDLFTLGQQMAAERKLELADAKFEFGRLATGQLVVIDEALTPDASRYFNRGEYYAHILGRTTDRPRQQSKEFVREWLAEHGFTNQPGEDTPVMPEEFIEEVTARYIALYQEMTGLEFWPRDYEDAEATMEQNVINALEQIKANGVAVKE